MEASLTVECFYSREAARLAVEDPGRQGILLVLGGEGRVLIDAEGWLRFVHLAGKPWLEPIQLHGPFVD